MINGVEQNKTILFLGDEKSPILSWLNSIGEAIIQTSEKITPKFISDNNTGFLISYGYRYIIKKNILELFPNRAINLHISYLPWNKGADPNFWSFINNTPKGITIHYLDEGVDTGDIIVQKQMYFDSDNETLSTSYDKLHLAIQKLFKQHWNEIKRGVCQREKQFGNGSIQKIKDKKPLLNKLTDGWNTPISILKTFSTAFK